MPLPPISQFTDIAESGLGEESSSGNGADCGEMGEAGGTVEQAVPETAGETVFLAELKEIYDSVVADGRYNYRGARRRVPSGLCIDAWRAYLRDYTDYKLVDYLAYGWPINFERGSPLRATPVNHTSATQHTEHIQHYIDTEMGFRALVGPFQGPPTANYHISPLMTHNKKDSDKRRVIMDLSWPDGASINDGIPEHQYIDGSATIKLPTVDYMESRILQLGRGAFLYKTDLAHGYRQLRVDPADWPLLGFAHAGDYFMDMCPPFGLRTSAMFMQRTAEAICFVHGRAGYVSRPYLDDFGGAEGSKERAERALRALQTIMRELGVNEAGHKVCQPAQRMVWLGLLYDTVEMTITIPAAKMDEIMQLLPVWGGKQRATRQEMQSLLGTLPFLAGVSPPTRVFTNRMLENLREMPKRGSESLSWGFKRDLSFFLALLPRFNGVKIIDKQTLVYQNVLELDACLVGCGACTDRQYYAERFPQEVQHTQHTIAHLELLNIVVAVKVWGEQWARRRVRIYCDNSNACQALRTGRSRDSYMQDCTREVFLFCAALDIELSVEHRAGKLLVRADALSRAATQGELDAVVARDDLLRGARRIRVPHSYFQLINAL